MSEHQAIQAGLVSPISRAECWEASALPWLARPAFLPQAALPGLWVCLRFTKLVKHKWHDSVVENGISIIMRVGITSLS